MVHFNRDNLVVICGPRLSPLLGQITKPLSPARIQRLYAVLSAAMNAAVLRKLTVNPCEGVDLPRVPKVRPVPWTPGREKAFWAALGQRERNAGRKSDYG